MPETAQTTHMVESKPQNVDSRPALPCISCGYDLRSHPRNARCPECGTPIKVSRKYRSEILNAVHNLPGLPRIMLCLCLATLTGAPALLSFCGLDLLAEFAFKGSDLATTLLKLLPWMLLAGSITPLLTMFAIPSNLVDPSVRRQLTIWLVCLGVVGWIMMLVGGPKLTEGIGALIGSTLAALGCAIGLGIVSKLIGGAIPQWGRMGSARQSVPPLVSAICLIGLLRILILLIPANWISTIWTLRGTLIGVEALLAIGSIYLLFNRLWLANSLNQARIAARLRSAPS